MLTVTYTRKRKEGFVNQITFMFGTDFENGTGKIVLVI